MNMPKTPAGLSALLLGGALLAASLSVSAQAQAPVISPAIDVREWQNAALPDDVFAQSGFGASDGAEIYATVCAGCHMPDGSGAVGGGMYPALKGNENLVGADYPIYMTLNGNKGMPAFGAFLSDAQVAALVNHLQVGINDYEREATVQLVADNRDETNAYRIDRRSGIEIAQAAATPRPEANSSASQDASSGAAMGQSTSAPPKDEGVIRHKTPGSTFPILMAAEVSDAASLVYLSGTVPQVVNTDAKRGSVEAYGNTQRQTETTLAAIGKKLESLGLTMRDVVKMQVYLVRPDGADGMDFSGFMKGYTQFFGTEEQPNLPTRSVFEVAGLASPAWLVEIEVVALRRGAAAPKEATGVVRHKNPGSTFPILMAAEVPRSEDLVYLSGTVPQVVNKDAKRGSLEAYGDTQQQTQTTLASIDKKLKSLGLSMGDVIKMQAFLVRPKGADGMDFSGFMKGYTQYFGTDEQPNLPTRSVMEVAGLVVPGWLVEIEVTAVRPK